MSSGQVVMGLLFFPRGGSAQVTRYLAAALERAGWSVSLVAGSLGPPGASTHAPTFFAGIDVHHLDYTPAVVAHAAGDDALMAPVPMHPSYEDRTDAVDPVLAAVDPDLVGALASVWEAPFRTAGADGADILHLHHLTPQLDAAVGRWPSVPVVVHLHGTEIKFLEVVEVNQSVARALGRTLATMPDDPAADATLDTAGLDDTQQEILATTRWSQWRHGEFWLHRLRQQAAMADHLVVVSPPDRETAISLLGLARSRVTAMPNGVDTDLFRPRPLGADERRACFRRYLVEDPQGWEEGGEPGSVAYGEADLDRLLGLDGATSVLVYVGRFTGAKRVPLLVKAFARARARSSNPMSLVVWGGHPGEWEGEHPVTVARRIGDDGVFFAGWRGHEDLPEGLAACDVLVMPSVNDSFAQTALESMAVGRPVIATRSGGFPSMINLDPRRPTGWLVDPDDVAGLAEAMVEVVEQPDERRRRGQAALAHARENLSWEGRVSGFEQVYAAARDHHGRGTDG
jgi:glycosyltransferase involved in cell wall biosynthesis